MKITCKRHVLLKGMQTILPAVAGAKGKQPILTNAKLTVSESGSLGSLDATITAYDGELGIRYMAKGFSGEPGTCLIPAGQFTKILQEGNTEELTIETGETETLIKAGRTKYKVPSFPVDDFPDLPATDGDIFHEIKSGLLKSMIRSTQYATDKNDSTRFALSGVLWHWSRTITKLVATDSKRLAIHGGESLAHGGKNDVMALVPKRAINLLEKTLMDNEDLIRVRISPNEVSFTNDTSVIYSRLIEGRFPPYQDIVDMSGKNAFRVVVKVKECMSCVRQAAIMTDTESSRLDITFGTDTIGMVARSQGLGSSDVEMAVNPNECGITTPIRMGIDPDYLLDFLKSVDDHETMEMWLSESARPLLLKAGSSIQSIIMPLAS